MRDVLESTGFQPERTRGLTEPARPLIRQAIEPKLVDAGVLSSAFDPC